MGRRELLDVLEREGRETMAAITGREAVEKERLRVDAEQRRAVMRLEYQRLSEQQCSDLQRRIMSKALREAALIRLRAEHSLSLRLYEHALISVMQMRSDDPEALFRGLVAELPPDEWLTVQVNPDIASLAARCFPEAEIVIDTTLSGGFKVTTPDGSLTIDNTLKTRLERLWPELLPQLMVELRERQE